MMTMRLVVMFDIPNGSARLRKMYGNFRKHLISEGFLMEQFSVYTRLVATREAAAIQIAKMRLALPEVGRVTVFELTEKQYARRHVLIHSLPAPADDAEDEGQLVLML